MNTSLRDLALYRCENENKDNAGTGRIYIRKSLWKDNDQRENDVKYTLYAGQGSYGRNPRHADRSAKDRYNKPVGGGDRTRTFGGACFHC